MNLQHVYREIKSNGKKLTKTRKGILKIFADSHNLFTAPEILGKLKEQGINVNKTTVYRELEFLLHNSFLTEVSIKPGITHYESAEFPHHHHITCEKCGKIKEVLTHELEESINKIEDKLQSGGFLVKEHNLEFLGVCISCGQDE